ncbi:MAG TPA: hypothetical protein VNC78_11245 [Actinomycetota bacterium]|nr:hypothetical protein [Actinomycetota bacterium]
MRNRVFAAVLAASLSVGVIGAVPALAKKKKPKPPAPCAAYTPGDQGSGAETTVVTSTATEETPVEVTVAAEPGLMLLGPDDATGGHAYHNIQVDSATPTAGLYVRMEFDNVPPVRDYDIWLNYPDGSNASNAHGFNPAHDSQFSPESDGGHTEANAEQIDGTASADCQGYTLDIGTATGEGGDVTLKMWLGDIQFTPAAPPSR